MNTYDSLVKGLKENLEKVRITMLDLSKSIASCYDSNIALQDAGRHLVSQTDDARRFADDAYPIVFGLADVQDAILDLVENIELVLLIGS